MNELIGTTWLHYRNGKRYVIAAVATNPNTGERIVSYVGPERDHAWRPYNEFMKKFSREKTFSNSSKRLWSEAECQTMVNAALLYLAHQAGGRLSFQTADIFTACEAMGAIAMALSDDDSTLTITGQKCI